MDEEELETYLADLGNQTQNLRLRISSVKADLVRAQEERELAASTEAWLMSLSRAEDGRPKVDVTYRLGIPEAGESLDSGQNSTLFWDRNSVSW